MLAVLYSPLFARLGFRSVLPDLQLELFPRFVHWGKVAKWQKARPAKIDSQRTRDKGVSGDQTSMSPGKASFGNPVGLCEIGSN